MRDMVNCFIVVAVVFFAAQAADTTYGKTRVVKRESSQSTRSTKSERCRGCSESSVSHSSSSSATNERHNRGFLERCISSEKEIESFKELGFRLLAFPFRLVFCTTCYGIGQGFAKSYGHLFVGDRSVSDYDDQMLRFGIVAGFGGHHWPGFSLGLAGNLGASLYTPLLGVLAFREQVIVNGTVIGVNDVYVNAQRQEIQRDTVQSHKYTSVYFSSQLLLKPGGRDGSLYIFCGGGPVYQSERVEVNRALWNMASSEQLRGRIRQSNRNWCPGVSAGVGRMGEVGEIFWGFELAYDLSFNRNEQVLFLRGDNSPYNHMLTMRWNFVF